MTLPSKIITPFLFLLCLKSYAQIPSSATTLAKIKNAGFQQSMAMNMLHELTDVYGQRLTGSRQYLNAAKWALQKMNDLGLDNVHFENYCKDCRGWDVKSFNVEMVVPNYMHIAAYPLAMTKSTKGIVEGEVIAIESFRDMVAVKKQFTGKLKDKIILLGRIPSVKSLPDTIFKRYSNEQLKTMEEMLAPATIQTPLPELLESFKVDDVTDKDFLLFAESEGALAVLKTSPRMTGILSVGGTYYYRENDLKPLPYFSIMPEHFSRLGRLLQKQLVPKIRLNLETSFYLEPDNNVNIIGEIKGRDPSLQSEVVLVGGHFDSWHSATGATDNAVSCVALIEALRILKQSGLTPKRTIRVGLWGGEEQAFIGSVSYAQDHYGELGKKPNNESQKVTAYLNLDHGAGAIRGLYLQGNAFAYSIFDEIFKQFSPSNSHTLTIENTLSTDHETFDHYNIPSFQFIQDPLSYSTVNHHTNLDFPEYVPEADLKKNAVLLAWTIYSLAEMNDKVPRKQLSK